MDMTAILPERLLPCPFCGVAAEQLRIAGRAAVRVRCRSCDCEWPVAAGCGAFDDVRGRVLAGAGERREAYELAAAEAARLWNCAPRPGIDVSTDEKGWATWRA